MLSFHWKTNALGHALSLLSKDCAHECSRSLSLRIYSTELGPFFKLSSEGLVSFGHLATRPCCCSVEPHLPFNPPQRTRCFQHGQIDTMMATTDIERVMEAPVKRRKLRKGTRSCLDCRRRKVKCIYATARSARCIVCERRGAQCISQHDSPALDDVVDDDASNSAGIRANDEDKHATPYLHHSFLTPQSLETPDYTLPLSDKVGHVSSFRGATTDLSIFRRRLQYRRLTRR